MEPRSSDPFKNELSHMYGISRTTCATSSRSWAGRGSFPYPRQGHLCRRAQDRGAVSVLLWNSGAVGKWVARSPSRSCLSRKRAGQKDLCQIFRDQKSCLFVVRRLRYLKTPLSVHTSYIPAELCPDLGRHDIATEQMCTILSQDYGLHRAKTIETLESVPATAHGSGSLNIAPGQPLLLLQDVIQNEDGLTFEYSKVAFRGEKIKITLEFNFGFARGKPRLHPLDAGGVFRVNKVSTQGKRACKLIQSCAQRFTRALPPFITS